MSVNRNMMSGSLPAAWSSLHKLAELHLLNNQLSGVVPAAWKGMSSMKFLTLSGNRQLGGCLPATWKGKVNVPGVKGEAGETYVPDDAWGTKSGTKITGFCKA